MADVVLNLTNKQAFILRLVLDRIGGDARVTDREHTQTIVDMLVEQDVPYDDDYENIKGSIEFLAEGKSSMTLNDFL